MTKSLLNLFLQRVAQGDESYLDRLLHQLAERLVFVPVAEENSATAGASFKVNVVRIREAHRSLVPVFTDEKHFKTWSESGSHKGGSISLLGADLCTALSTDAWIAVNPGSDDLVELQPFLVQKLKTIGAQEPITLDNPVPAHVTEQSEVAQTIARPIADEVKNIQIENLEPKKKKRSFLSFLKMG